MNFTEIYSKCKDYTITSYERMFTLHKAVVLINEKELDGDFVECGVYKGGSIMNMAYSQLNYKKRVHIHLYDSFEGMPTPTEIDKDYMGVSALKHKGTCFCTIDEVISNVNQTNYPNDFLHYHKGDVKETLTQNVPDKISILRLDTDWYESTKIEIEILYPKLISGGILIIDDYGHFMGCKKAIDEYFGKMKINPFFEQIDYTGIWHIKG
jgi:O-methyltransferase